MVYAPSNLTPYLEVDGVIRAQWRKFKEMVTEIRYVLGFISGNSSAQVVLSHTYLYEFSGCS